MMLVLGLASSHAPVMFLPVEQWPALHALQTGDTPQPPAVAAETPETNAVARQRIDAGFAALRSALAAARPDVLLIVGDDQEEVFGPPVNPTLAVFCGEKVSGSTMPIFRDQPGIDRSVALECHAELGRHLAAGLVKRDFDPAVMTELRPLSRPNGIGHAFTRPAHALGVAEAGIRVVPIFLNAYHDPLPSSQRCYDLGQAIREIADGRPERIAVLGSGGLSHDPRGPRAGWIDQRLDRWVLDRIAEGHSEDLTRLFTFDSDSLRGGSGEIRSWIAVAGALPGVRAQVIDYIPLHHGITGLGFAYWEPGA
jgi:Catalytic LigB subunit of aromatic ring-opening dioxygenase